VNYISKEEALTAFKETFADRPEIYEGIDPDVLPPSLQLQLEDPAAADEVAQRLREEHGLHRREPQLPAADHRAPQRGNLGHDLGASTGRRSCS
jgi:cell division protein FtsX